jgi:acetylornithine deacetylase/succinyl-diaminopimelate desuccinylase-like protein
VLERAGAPLGVVTAIAGQARGAVVFEGRADHAGTTPMHARDDALLKAARFVLHVRGLRA